MLVSTLDLLTQAASNSLYVFCLCNLIIVMIVVGSKPGSYIDQESESPHSKVTYRVSYEKQLHHEDDAKCEQKSKTNSASVIGSVVSNAKKEVASNVKAGIDHQNNGDMECECDNDDELTRRVEEFIENVNKGWRAELLRTSRRPAM